MNASRPSLVARLVLALLVLSGTPAASRAAVPPSFGWETVVDTPEPGGGGYEVLHDVVQTPDGGFVAAGYAIPPDTFDGRLQQPLVIRYDRLGGERWRTLMDVPRDQGYEVRRIRPTGDGGFVVACTAWTPFPENGPGLYYNTSFVARLDGDGALQWRYRIDPLEMDEIGDFALAADGSVLAAGRVWGTGGVTHVALLKLSPSGSLVWLRKADPDFAEGVALVALTPDGGLYAVTRAGLGLHLSRYSPEGVPAWTSPVGETDGTVWLYEKNVDGLTVLPDGGCVIAGAAREYNHPVYGPFRPFLAYFSARGRQTATLVVQTESAWSHSVRRLPDGGILSAEGIEGSDTGPLFVRYDARGREVWRAAYGEIPRFRYIEALRETADGGFVAVGAIDVPDRYSSMDGYILKVDGAGGPAPVAARIDVMPGNASNPVNPGSRGLLPVALLSSEGFDAASVDAASVTLEGASPARDGRGRPMTVVRDVDGDGRADLLLFFPVPSLRLAQGSTGVTMNGETPDGGRFRASDTIRVVGR